MDKEISNKYHFQLEQIICQEYSDAAIKIVKDLAVDHFNQCHNLYSEIKIKNSKQNEILIQHAYELFKKKFEEYTLHPFNNKNFEIKTKELTYSFIDEISGSLEGLKAESIRLLDIHLKMQIQHTLTLIGLKCNPKIKDKQWTNQGHL